MNIGKRGEDVFDHRFRACANAFAAVNRAVTRPEPCTCRRWFASHDRPDAQRRTRAAPAGHGCLQGARGADRGDRAQGDRHRLSPRRHRGVLPERARRRATGSKGTDTWVTTKLAPGRHDAADVCGRAGREPGADGAGQRRPVPDPLAGPAAGQVRRGVARRWWTAREAGKARSIGVCNFLPEHLDAIIAATGVTPVDQPDRTASGVPAARRAGLWPRPRDRHPKLESARSRRRAEGRTDYRPSPRRTAGRRRRSSSPGIWPRVWPSFPKASSAEHLSDNFAAQDVVLSDEDIAAIDAMDDAGGRIGPDPSTM